MDFLIRKFAVSIPACAAPAAAPHVARAGPGRIVVAGDPARRAGMLFETDLDTLPISKLVVEAAAIVEKLVGNDAFFLHSFGSVLRLIAGESLNVKSSISDEDILQIRANLKCTVSYDMEPPHTAYMECDPGMPGTSSKIIINPVVRSYPGIHDFLKYVLVIHDFLIFLVH
jgi:hypothetical protein